MEEFVLVLYSSSGLSRLGVIYNTHHFMEYYCNLFSREHVKIKLIFLERYLSESSRYANCLSLQFERVVRSRRKELENE